MPSRIDSGIVISLAFVGCRGSPFADSRITSLNDLQICKRSKVNRKGAEDAKEALTAC